MSASKGWTFPMTSPWPLPGLLHQEVTSLVGFIKTLPLIERALSCLILILSEGYYRPLTSSDLCFCFLCQHQLSSHSLTLTHTHSVTYSHSLTHTHSHTLSQLLTHSLTHSLTNIRLCSHIHNSQVTFLLCNPGCGHTAPTCVLSSSPLHWGGLPESKLTQVHIIQ